MSLLECKVFILHSFYLINEKLRNCELVANYKLQNAPCALIG